MSEELREISVKDAMELMHAGRYRQAIEMCDEILAQMPDNATAICVRENCRWKKGADPQACVANLERALEIAPDSHVVRNYLATILISNGQNDRAQQLLTESLSLEPDNVQSFNELVEITRFGEEIELLRAMRAQYEKPDQPAPRREALAFSLAKAYDDIGDAETAIKYATDGNALADRTFNTEASTARLADLKALAGHGLRGMPDSGYSGGEPVFIVGMPRSGTTLVETILSRHPDVHAAGELNIIQAVESKVRRWLAEDRGIKAGAQTMLEHVPATIWAQNADKIVEIIRHQAGWDFKRYTDKMPENARRLPLISRLFPRAPIIYVRRHPLDACISNYFMRFTNLGFSFRQDWLGLYYRQLTESVALSRRIIPNPVLDLSYDLLVAEPEPQTRRLVAFAGLEWNDACLSPEQSDRATVMTASRWQVRQPIYTTSTARWKRYEPWIGEMIEAMGGMAWIEAQVAEADEAGRT